MQDELDFEVGEQSKLTEADMLDALYARYCSAAAAMGSVTLSPPRSALRPGSTHAARPTSLPWTCGRPSGSPCTATR